MNYINLNTVKEIKEYIEMSLSEVAECNDEFNDGQRHAYNKALELFQSCLNGSKRKAGLDYPVKFLGLKKVKDIKEYIEISLSEISKRVDEFSDGEMHAYIETLELLQSRLTDSERREAELDYSVEGVYPLKKMPL